MTKPPLIVCHVTSEAQEGGPIALVKNRDQITINATANKISIELSGEELAIRSREWHMPSYKADRGTLAKYIRLVKSASSGCVTDE